ncbi:hypothetical protein ABB37_04777 [Leptomonas pyrrhocoris]|uniref:Uncharacterized protein n=1 Tax=Leptomonas pyrrhocoris TaxID=157538 RepID=A0A0M9G203_LEPPY|nr:hypothetical protein ABB37_04777 [Leptomonas pyrrhocoris]KPA80577.1 hypothetical protein ABB37_04777 [Leptomonas pyrrhocoris]|eukprot:XP_015659016.1 hypothetical protein ABB37_04777 [Leptomonas pyrrhocoris]
MSSVAANQYRANVLFRLLAFLDNTGTQPFVLAKEVSADGHFLHPEVVFADGTAVAAILAASLQALRANVARLFASAEEQRALLNAIGTGVRKEAATADAVLPPSPARPAAPLSTARDATADANGVAQTQEREGDPPSGKDVAALTSKPVSLPRDTKWSYLVCHPVSLLHYAEQVESELPIHLLVRLREVLGVAPAAASPPPNDSDADPVTLPIATFSDTPFVEQMLIDGLDEWMRSCPVDEVRRVILACGVQPTVLSFAFEQQQQPQKQSSAAEKAPFVFSSERANTLLPDSLVDFVVDVVFPVSTVSTSPSSSTAGTQSTTATSTPGEGLQDWLLLSYEKNHETIEVGEEEEEEEDVNSNDSDAGGGDRPRKVPHAEGGRRPQASPKDDGETNSLGAWQPQDGEEVLTADNIDRYLKEYPQRIPKEILRAKRKLITDPAITAFELENHYTAAELRKLIKEEVGSMTAVEATVLMGCPISEAQVVQAAGATRKAQFVEWVLAAHQGRASSAQDKSWE